MNFFKTMNAKKAVITALLLLVACFSSCIAYNYFGGNFHVVIPGKVYRSAQPNAYELSDYMSKYDIRSILNLRGKYPGDAWYKNELAFSHEMDIQHYDLGLPAHGLPTKQQLDELVSILRHAPKPILIHCKNGADRTGLASSISVVLANNPSLDALEDQSSWQYDALSPQTIGYEVMSNYLVWLQQHHLSNSKADFLAWLHSERHLKSYSGWFLT